MTVKDDTMVEVRNLTAHTVGYTTNNARRVFAGQQTMRVPAGELRELTYTRGGNVIIKNYLQVCNKELAIELGVEDVEHEYQWTAEDVVDLLQNGSVERLEDALDFAPEGIVDLIIDVAVATGLPDTNKRKIITEMTGKDVNAMIMHVEESEKYSEPAVRAGKVRRVKDEVKEEAAPTERKRRVSN